MPKVQEKVKEFFGKEPRKDVNPDEAVAVGAAIQGQVLVGDRKDVLLLDVTPLSLGIETLGGVMTKMIQKNTTIPTKFAQTFSTADDNQPAVTIKVYQGEREMAVGQQAARRVQPRRHPAGAARHAADRGHASTSTPTASCTSAPRTRRTGKENKITIKANSGLSEAEIQKMVKDAELNAADDKKKLELSRRATRPTRWSTACSKSLTEHGDKLDAGEKEKIEAALKDVEEALKCEDKADDRGQDRGADDGEPEAGREDVRRRAGGAAGGRRRGGGRRRRRQRRGAQAQSARSDDNVVDAEFKEVKKG